MHLTRLFQMLCVGWLALASIQAATDWPEFRGPQGQGISWATNVPVTWGATNNVAWRSRLEGEGWSSPVVYKGRVYLTYAVPGSGSGVELRVMALDANTGRLWWDTGVFSEPTSGGSMHQKNSKASPTPLISGDMLFVHYGHLGTACLDLQGDVRWRQTSLKYNPVHGNGGSPIRVGDSLFFSCDGAQDPFAVALSIRDGSVLWRVDRKTSAEKKFSFSTALLITNGTRQEIISPASGAVFAYDPAQGRELWRVDYGNGYSVIPRPVFSNGLLFIGTGYDKPNLLAIRPGGTGNLTASNIVWQTSRSAPNTPSVLAMGEEVYFISDGGIATCADAKTGKVHWNERLDGDYSASPVWAEGRIYFLNEAGLTTVVRASTKFEVLAKNDIGQKTLASPAVIDGAIFIRSRDIMFRVGPRAVRPRAGG